MPYTQTITIITNNRHPGDKRTGNAIIHRYKKRTGNYRYPTPLLWFVADTFYQDLATTTPIDAFIGEGAMPTTSYPEIKAAFDLTEPTTETTTAQAVPIL